MKQVSRLTYSNSGHAIQALLSNGVHKLWEWQKENANLEGRATISVKIELRQPPAWNWMTNDTSDTNPEDAVPCSALSMNDLLSASRGTILCGIFLLLLIKEKKVKSFFHPSRDVMVELLSPFPKKGDAIEASASWHIWPTFTCKVVNTILPADIHTTTAFLHTPSPTTFSAFHPQDKTIIAIGMEDSSIRIYNNPRTYFHCRGHQERITGLAFSGVLNVLVSSGADSQLCVWSTDGLEKRASKFLQMLPGRGAAPPADTRVQFHVDQIHLLVVHKTQIATYEAPDLECLHQWVTREASSPITDATFSCNGQSIYVSFEDGSIGVLTTSTFRLRCCINPTAYIPANPSLRVYPLVIAAHPWEPNKFALGLTDGSVYMLEPLGSKGKWGTPPPVKNGAGPSTTTRRNRFRSTRKVNNLPVKILPVTYKNQSHGQSSYSSDDLPKNVVMSTPNQGSPIKSMDFHPEQQILLLVGTNMGDVMVWEVGSRARIFLRNFKVRDLGSCSRTLQASLANDYRASVNRVMWCPDGTLFGVAYSKHIVHIYSYHGGDDIRNHLELCVVTCGDDWLIKVWDAVTGAKQHSFKGHEAPVYSVCPRCTENVQFIYSASTDGKIKAWFYDDGGPRVDYDAPGRSSVVMAFSADGTRLFSHGTNIEEESHLVEWDEGMWTIRRWYCGLRRKLGGIGQFDISKNGFLAAGDECMVKFWDMDNNNILTTTDAEGGLPASPCIRFNKEGTLLAVSKIDSGFKILANPDGIMLLRTVENWLF
ncbi:hypothetical protein EUGRSUZ_C01846 [Eucalyptus grandis]|uniref:Uncharacterized protein n=2 Tax=Eucalyptus grandis TaxID=71139 RepID=A0A059CPX6_EUCGR|nr:hypothetical protein EUGRSUZ_C01846 [Eucalyptus grandis]